MTKTTPKRPPVPRRVVSCVSCGAEVHLRQGPDGKWRAVTCPKCRQLVEG